MSCMWSNILIYLSFCAQYFLKIKLFVIIVHSDASYNLYRSQTQRHESGSILQMSIEDPSMSCYALHPEGLGSTLEPLLAHAT